MKLLVRVYPRAKHEKTEKQPDGSYKIWVTSPPVDGKANKAVIECMARFLDRPKSHIEVVRGATGTRKILEIRD